MSSMATEARSFCFGMRLPRRGPLAGEQHVVLGLAGRLVEARLPKFGGWQ